MGQFLYSLSLLSEEATVGKGPGDGLSQKTGTPGEFQEPLLGSEAPHVQAPPPPPGNILAGWSVLAAQVQSLEATSRAHL